MSDSSDFEIVKEDSLLDIITKDYLTSDQAFVFSDEFTLYMDTKIVESVIVMVDNFVYILFKDSKATILKPF